MCLYVFLCMCEFECVSFCMCVCVLCVCFVCVCMSVLYDTAMIICKGCVKTVMGSII